MKKVFFVSALFLGLTITAHAQNTTTTTESSSRNTSSSVQDRRPSVAPARNNGRVVDNSNGPSRGISNQSSGQSYRNNNTSTSRNNANTSSRNNSNNNASVQRDARYNGNSNYRTANRRED